MTSAKFSTIPEAVEQIKRGGVVIVLDDEDRENEGDLVCAAELVTPDMINFMIRQAAGKLCIA
ncbi:MAG: 3,4-dihydroxy-2-butanone-4-phosphate synthase, partial [Planctomycetota bacterium]